MTELLNQTCCLFRSVPSEDPSGQSVVLPSWEISRIKYASRVLTEEEKKAQIERYKMAKEEQMVSLGVALFLFF